MLPAIERPCEHVSLWETREIGESAAETEAVLESRQGFFIDVFWDYNMSIICSIYRWRKEYVPSRPSRR